MIFFAVFALIGGLVGVSAAIRKGWSPVAGFLGGALLGVFSPLLYFVDGVASKPNPKG